MPRILQGDWALPTRIWSGAGRLAELPQACRAHAIGRPLAVIDPGLVGLPFVNQAIDQLRQAGMAVETFSGLAPNPGEAHVAAGIAASQAGGHDGIVAIGGGSAMDTAKAIALMTGQTRPLMDFIDAGDNWRRADGAAILPVIAVPTTAGTGSEVGRSAVVTAAASQRKVVIFHPALMPALVIADPELTVGLPPGLTAATGMDALSHSLEAYCVDAYHPICDGIALEGMRLVARWLPIAVANGKDIEARAEMLTAAAMGATAFQKGLGAMHAMSHPCSARHGSQHGLTNAIVMPYVLAYNRPAIEERMEILARLLGLARPGFSAVLDWILDLRQQIGIPHNLAALGIGEADIEHLAPDAFADPLTQLNPVPVTEQDYRDLYGQAIRGDTL
ncbi:MAG: iron-containing alcohol dehydrogenase [Proteobacteria bacterium]|nr:iron-containing alcohol dehydrogenase [Pseudomonadota bacterium]